jgi:hypothetical protein
MKDRETVLRIYCALLSRDPMAQQRFTALGERFEQLAHLAHAAAAQFDEVAAVWLADEKHAEVLAAKLWDLRSVSVEPLMKQPKNLISVDDEHQLPKSQGDLLGEMRQ